MVGEVRGKKQIPPRRRAAGRQAKAYHELPQTRYLGLESGCVHRAAANVLQQLVLGFPSPLLQNIWQVKANKARHPCTMPRTQDWR